ncbi:MAG: hypothetical protein GY856_21560, partial [bacterium]|nr:hypothetical protein [bacterium]
MRKLSRVERSLNATKAVSMTRYLLPSQLQTASSGRQVTSILPEPRAFRMFADKLRHGQIEFGSLPTGTSVVQYETRDSTPGFATVSDERLRQTLRWLNRHSEEFNCLNIDEQLKQLFEQPALRQCSLTDVSAFDFDLAENFGMIPMDYNPPSLRSCAHWLDGNVLTSRQSDTSKTLQRKIDETPALRAMLERSSTSTVSAAPKKVALSIPRSSGTAINVLDKAKHTNVDAGAFPTHLPAGENGLNTSAGCSVRDYCRTRATSTRCQLRSGDYLFWLLNMDEQDQIASQVRVQMARKGSALEQRAS